MKKNKTQFIFKASILILAIFLLNIKTFSRISANGAGGGYDDPDGKSNLVSTKENSIIENYIEKGGGYFLNAYSDILSISNRIEMANIQGLVYEELKSILNSAIENIRNAKATYYLLIKKAQDTPYDPVVNLKLRSFDYQEFMTEYSLNSDIFYEVEGYLKIGNITGTFIRIYNSFINIEKLLLSIKSEISLDKMPTLSKIWEINQESSSTLIFGQYIARIFYEL